MHETGNKSYNSIVYYYYSLINTMNIVLKHLDIWIYYILLKYKH